ncbi:ESX secretion-associated protein EspG [Actinocrispum wychmicini]|uniref:ESAT-6 protein secretion system EspG family protein n=1 Tax=Actinocrispum wychmicini TaxID=1213861 RepID=A0A4R2KFL8_9PSEU|nr:ESX secretion-associated protein EspG [Actinocrispum wychmicini]TCO65285.1 ESAT-6 protein secretion system EspG family protein [Actinocrispum wychmicini]
MPTSFALSFAAVDILSEGLGVNCRMYPFQIPSFGEFPEDRARIAEAIKNDMIGRGLADHHTLAPEVMDALTLLSEYQVAVAVMGDVDNGKQVFARGSATARRGMVVRQDGQILKFELVRPESLARSIVAMLPPLNAGPGQSATITRPIKRAPRPDEEMALRQQIRTPRGMSTAQIRSAGEILRRKRVGSGHFTVNGRDRFGKTTQAPGLGWIDTDAGRYLVQSHIDEDTTGGTYFPADNARVIHQLNELLKSVG